LDDVPEDCWFFMQLSQQPFVTNGNYCEIRLSISKKNYDHILKFTVIPRFLLHSYPKVEMLTDAELENIGT
jgi:hypothetical protein